jgi:diketogulonate reductase-like aldo/keto reductase
MRSITLSNGAKASVLGQGTWRLGEDQSRRAAETAAVRAGVELGMTLVDTAEMYGDGNTESFLGHALDGLRDKVFLVSKVYPHNAGRGRIEKACEASLRRLKTNHLDLYLLHWRGSVPLAETVEGMEALKTAGKITAWGVSNLDVADMNELAAAGGGGCVANQILYNLTQRGPEFDLITDLARRSAVAVAYSPVAQGRLPSSGALATVAGRYGVSPYQIALAWVLRDPIVLAIPKAASLEHVHQNAHAANLRLTAGDLEELDAAFPPPKRKTRLAML